MMSEPDDLSKDPQLAEALAKTRARRMKAGINPDTGGAPSVPKLAEAVTADRPNGSVLRRDHNQLAISQAKALFGPALGLTKQTYFCSQKVAPHVVCNARIPFPGICMRCAERAEHAEREEAIHVRIQTEIPEMFADVRWAALPTLRNDTNSGPRVVAAPGRLAGIRQGLETATRSIIVGPTGSGKTSLVFAFLRQALEEGVETARCVRAILLEETDAGMAVYERVLNARKLVIDDVGAELHGAPEKSGLASQRIRLVDNLVSIRFERKLQTVITTEHPRWSITKFYGPAIARRMFTGALLIEVGQESDIEALPDAGGHQ